MKRMEEERKQKAKKNFGSKKNWEPINSLLLVLIISYLLKEFYFTIINRKYILHMFQLTIPKEILPF